jgi:hypothetical protein
MMSDLRLLVRDAQELEPGRQIEAVGLIAPQIPGM